MMNPIVKKKWLKALRSGKYKKTTHALHCGKGFCCLGVLTDLYIKENPKYRSWKRATDSSMSYKGEGSIIPSSVKRWAGIKASNPVMNVRGSIIQANLAELNDGSWQIKPWSFKRIAKLIEAQL